MSNPERPEFTVRQSGVREINPSVEHKGNVKFMVFIDAENLRISTNHLRGAEGDFSYAQLFNLISSDGADSMGINFYANGADLPENFLRFLLDNGVRIVAVPGKEMGGGRKGGPVDTVIATDMLDQADRYEEAVLVSGDGDFGYTVEQLIKRGKKVTVISSWRDLGRELPASGAQIILLEDIISMLTYTRNPKPQLKVVS